ncbi:MAG: aminotransferase class V-fold PLP-dependent enzyme [Deltaproteobacteria bacterium]|nr:aminotransferase class V-fold PLP-dependent enzyme [Deltaproteobacteria bacterium]
MAEERPIYLDHQATTPCDPRVVDAMLPYLTGEFGNAASRTHAYGWNAAAAVDRARGQVAALIGADPREIVFTSGATEANNLAILGAARAALRGGDRDIHLLTCRTEHRAVLDPCESLKPEGVRVTALDVDALGRLDAAAFEKALNGGATLVSLMHANNEIGVVHDIASLSGATRERGVLFHCDAAQSVGKLPVDARALGVDLLSFTAHKLYGPKGIGALWVRRGDPPVRLVPQILGGGHERGLRSGTVPVALVVAFGVACEIAAVEREDEATRLAALRDALLARLSSELDGVHLNGHAELRLPGNLNVSFEGVESEALLMALPGVALSSGSACTSARPEPSHVLRALGLGAARAHSAVRIGLGRTTTPGEIERAGSQIVAEVRRLRELSPTWESRGRVRT